jgi:gamma-glutamyltranspeptidase/glutathione hydrolase
LLSRFGAKVTLPGSGILMNNGMMWFDPRPGPAERDGAGQTPARQHVPVGGDARRRAGVRDGCGGGPPDRPGLTQLTTFLLDFACRSRDAFHVPRLDRPPTRTVV